jgi:hypothetical protein
MLKLSLQDCVFGADRKSNMASRAYNVFWLVEILKIFLLESTKPIELWLCRQKSCIWPSNEHFCQVCFKSVLWFQKKRISPNQTIHPPHKAYGKNSDAIILNRFQKYTNLGSSKFCTWNYYKCLILINIRWNLSFSIFPLAMRNDELIRNRKKTILTPTYWFSYANICSLVRLYLNKIQSIYT